LQNKDYLFSSSNTAVRGFGYLIKYPNLFDKNDSKDIFTVQEDEQGTIWVGSYNKTIASINKKNKISLTANAGLMNGGLKIKDKLFFIQETGLFNANMLTIDKNGNKQFVANTANITGFCLYKSKANDVYFGTSQKGLWRCNATDFYNCKPIWQKIDTNQLSYLVNILTITEDTLGRIWFAHPKFGIGFYNPKTNKTQYFILTKKEIAFGAMASIVDKKGTVWFGAHPGGLWYYNEYKNNFTTNSFKKVLHPFFENDCKITAMCIKDENLIINANDKTVVLNLDSFYAGNVNVKYLTSMESNYSATTEQNTLLVAKDSTVWYSTSDMLYQWDFNSWLQIPKAKINLHAIIKDAKNIDTLLENDNFKIAPDANSITIELNYYNRDLLPRYFSTALQYNNDSIVWSKASINTIFNYSNLKAGNYIFYVKICELDGTLTYRQYHFFVDEFWYKKWWVIGLIALGILVTILYLFRLRNLKKLADEKALTQAAQFENTIALQKNELAKLQAISISNQFRPHFLLNTLNAIGSYLYKQPDAEKLLSRTGESINILFSQARSNNNIHSIANEMDLVHNVIEIFKIVYLKNLEVNLPNDLDLQTIKEMQVPFGLLQIPIENAMLHGLNNKTKGPYNLSIHLQNDADSITFTITDNGIGRAKAGALSNTRKHGTGLVNLYKIIDIYNQFNTNFIEMKFIDDVYPQEEAHGTQIIITIPKNYQYGN
jgi:hypothetical protein